MSVDISEDAPDRLSLSSEPSNGSTGVGVAGRPPTPSNSAASAVAAVAAAAAAAVVAPVAAVASVVAPVSTTPTGGGRGAADDIKSRRQDWKLDAQELSLIRKEEERVMKPDVLTRLLAKGAGLGCEWGLGVGLAGKDEHKDIMGTVGVRRGGSADSMPASDVVLFFVFALRNFWGCP